MNLEELQSVRDHERRTDKLQQLRESFYADAGEFIQSLRKERERAAERAEEPFDAPEVNRLSDEIDTAEQTVEAIYEKRVGKLVKSASLAAADMSAETDGMTAEEQDLFERLVADIEDNREHVLDVLAGDATATEEADADRSPPSEEGDADRSPPSEEGEPTGASIDAADVMGGPESASAAGSDAAGPDAPPPDARGDGAGIPSGSRAAAPDSNAGRSETSDTRGSTTGEPSPGGVGRDGRAGHERETVRITADVGTILGVDEREYDLSEDDVVRLPATNAEPLVERDAAEPIE